MDASAIGVGAILSQVDEKDIERAIEFASLSLSKTEYSIQFDVTKFDRKLTLVVDNKH